MSMKLFEIDNAKGHYILCAGLSRSGISFDGYDSGKAVEEFWNSSEYEYHYEFRGNEALKLLKMLGITGRNEEKIMTQLKERIYELDSLEKIINECKQQEIKYEFFSYFDMDMDD